MNVRAPRERQLARASAWIGRRDPVGKLPEKIEITGVPPHLESWTVAKIDGFVAAVLNRWQRAHGNLPERFTIVMCPQVEINAIGGIPSRVIELTDPKLRCRHFTGCHKPYFVVFFTGDKAEEQRAGVQEFLSWSESYAVHISDEKIRLAFIDATEDAGHEEERRPGSRSFRSLLESGELVSILE